MKPQAALPALLLLAAAAALPPGGSAAVGTENRPRAELSLSPSGPVTVGDPVEAVLTVRLPNEPDDPGAEPRFPLWGRRWGEAEVVEAGEPQRVEHGGEVSYRQRLVLTAFRPGTVELPPVEVAVPSPGDGGRTRALATPAGLAFEVRSVLPPGDEVPAPMPPAGLRRLPWGAPFWAALAGFGAAALLLSALLLRRRRSATASAATRPAAPPLPELLAELDGAAGLASSLEAHTRLSFALRRYLGRRLPFPALESTTSEVHRRLLSHQIPGPLTRRAVELLRACDLVKFARREDGPERARERVEAAREIGRELEDLFQPAAPQAGNGPAPPADLPLNREAAG